MLRTPPTKHMRNVSNNYKNSNIMTSETEILNFKEQLTTRLNSKFPAFDKCWEDIVNVLGNDFVGLIRDRFKDELQLFKEISQFQFSVVIDNNFIFGQIKNVIEKNKKIEDSFIYKLVKAKHIDVFAPPKLKDELYDKIQTVLTTENKLAEEYANLLIKGIIIKDAQWIEEWKNANNLIGHIDRDDVPYLALAFHNKSHAIISNDKVFKKQGSCKSWNIPDTDKVITSYNSGFISFCFIGASMSILKMIWQTLISIFKIIGELILEIITVIGMLVYGAFDLLINKIPPWISLSIFALGVGVAIFSEDFRKKGADFLEKTGEIAKAIIEKVESFIKWMYEIVKEFWAVFKPVGITGLEIAGYFALEFQLMSLQIEKLDNERAK